MRVLTLFASALACLLAFTACATTDATLQSKENTGQSKENTGQSQENTGDGFDAALARELGADDYGMRTYVFALLKTGPTQITDEARRQELFAGHFSNMRRLAKQGKLVMSGPFMDGGDKRGLFILNTDSLEEAEALVASDPAIAAGVFEVELIKHYGSAAMLKINDLHKTIQKKKVG